MEMGHFPKPASLFLLIFCVATSKYGQGNISPSTINSWVSKLGSELWTFGDVWTRRQQMIQSFTDAKVESREGLKLVQDIAREIRNMMELKISAVKIAHAGQPDSVPLIERSKRGISIWGRSSYFNVSKFVSVASKYYFKMPFLFAGWVNGIIELALYVVQKLIDKE